MDGLGDALSRFNKNAGEESEPKHEAPKHDSKHEKGGAHSYHVHKHSDGSHHLSVHKGGQMVHHSEHASLEEATEAMKHHGTGGGEEPGVGDEPQL